MTILQSRSRLFQFEGLHFLAELPAGAAHWAQITDALADRLDLTDEEREIPPGQPRPAWITNFLFASVQLSKAGWLTKTNGTWAITSAGRQALKDYPRAETFGPAMAASYQEWAANRPTPAMRRAWLVRGSSVLGMNVVPEWIGQDFCSVAGTHLKPIGPGITVDELREVAAESYEHLKHHEQRAKIDEIVAFVTRINIGDLVLTTSEGYSYVGDVTGDWAYKESDGGRTNLRRAVAWRNPETPIDFADLPAPLPARLQTGSTVLDLTEDIDVIDAMTAPDIVGIDSDGGAPDDIAPRKPRHEHLPEPSETLAKELFVGHDWLCEVAEILDERRQLVFYGPPGTGKTYIARKLAADLVGLEQVKLVQFHPAYTYEDFFEGYRPAAGSAAGTISFELKAGPLRQLVNRARQHPEQAFVLIIDEINRAHLAKVFGELYFLLEYRDQAVDLLYSADDEGFTLPTNLYVIGTMNTADRSIALFDAAMRRRFAFVALDPDTEPTKSLLAEWSAALGLGDTAAVLLAELNRRIEDPDFRIGPAYFMKDTRPDAHSPERLDRVWRTSILPLLEEHHYGEWDSVQRRYDLRSLLSAIGVTPAEPPDPAADPQPVTPIAENEPATPPDATSS